MKSEEKKRERTKREEEMPLTEIEILISFEGNTQAERYGHEVRIRSLCNT